MFLSRTANDRVVTIFAYAVDHIFAYTVSKPKRYPILAIFVARTLVNVKNENYLDLTVGFRLYSKKSSFEFPNFFIRTVFFSLEI